MTADPGGREHGGRRWRVALVDVDDPGADLAVDGCEAVAAIVERDGEPLGRVVVPVVTANGVMPAEAVAGRIRAELWWELWREELGRRVRARLGGPWWEGLPRMPRTVVVCTRDRPGSLDRCLAALEELRPAPDRVLVVDNAPREPCRDIVERHGFDYLLEPRPGLDNARNAALASCRTELIAFTDDDCVAHPAWLARLERHFANRSVAAVTGWGAAYRLDTEAQLAFESDGAFLRGNRVLRFDWERLAPAEAGAVGAGANMCFRADALRAIGGFAPELDAGTPTRSGGDYDAFARVLAAGHRIVFDPASLVWHDHRETREELRGLMRGYGLGLGATTAKALVEARDPSALGAAKWPLSYLRRRVRGYVRGSVGREELVGALELARGLCAAPAAWRRSRRHERALGGVGALGPAPASAPAPPVDAADGPRVSVVIPTVPGREAALARCLDGLDAQRLPRARFEVVVVANGPGAREWTADPRIDRALRSSVPGAGRARNLGAEAAGGEVIVFLDDDLVPGPACLEEHVRAHAGGASVTLGPSYPDGLGASLLEQAVARWWFDHFARKHRPGHRVTFTDVLSGNLGIRAVLLAEHGGFDPALGAGRREDWELGCRLLAAGLSPVPVPAAEAVHHQALDVARVLRDKEGEGYGDVLLVGRHPDVAASLPLAGLLGRARGGWRSRAGPHVGGELVSGRLAVAGAALGALEAAGARRRWSRLMGRLMRIAYRAGVARALEEGHRLPERPVRPRLVIDLDGDGPVDVGRAMGDVAFVLGGREIGSIGLSGSQWDEDEIVEAAVEAVGGPALLARASGRAG
jgi:glycosyltransferase involved in cell wall biosynthesis